MYTAVNLSITGSLGPGPRAPTLIKEIGPSHDVHGRQISILVTHLPRSARRIIGITDPSHAFSENVRRPSEKHRPTHSHSHRGGEGRVPNSHIAQEGGRRRPRLA